MVPVKTLFRKTQALTIASSLYRQYNHMVRGVIRSASVSTVSIMDTLLSHSFETSLWQLFSRILLLEDVIITNSSRVAFTYLKNIPLGIYCNLRLDGMPFLLSGIVFLLYPLFRTSPLLLCSIGYNLSKFKAYNEQFLKGRNFLDSLRNPVSYRLTQRRISGFF